MKSVRVSIEGRVQGVWYRGWTVQEAQRRGIAGWVRNRRDGTVEAVFHGVDQQVEDMVEACWNGPPAARVDAVRVEPCAPPDDTGGFHQKATL